MSSWTIRALPFALAAATAGGIGCAAAKRTNGSVSNCSDGQLGVGCQAGHCLLRAASGTLRGGATVQLAEQPLPDELTPDAVGTVLCQVTLPSGALAGDLTLTIATDDVPAPAAVMFQYSPPAPASLVRTSAPGQKTVSGLIGSSGGYGITLRPEPWRVLGVAGTDTSQSGDLASLIRNLSTRFYGAAASDGTRLFLGNGTRLLIYPSLPTSPAVKPLVLGQPSLDSDGFGTSSLTFSGVVNGVWSDGNRLAVATGNRVLIWNPVPTRNFEPADLVLGQSNFSSDTVDAVGASASTLARPTQIDSDGTRLLVADSLNHRVLVWSTFPSSIGQPATSVIGQPTMTSSTIYGGAAPMYQPFGALLAPSGGFVAGLFGLGFFHIPQISQMNAAPDFEPVRETIGHGTDRITEVAGLARIAGGGLVARDRQDNFVAVFPSVPAAPTRFSFVLGQPDPLRSLIGPPSASALSWQLTWQRCAVGGGSRLLVPDAFRVLVWESSPSYNYEPASLVIGQPGFTTNGSGIDYRGISAATLASPADVAVAGGQMAVADRGNNRVLLYTTASVVSAMPAAALVIGQPDMVSYIPNLDQRTPNDSRVSGPGGVALDGTHLIVADTENHRVLIWSSVPTRSGQPADLVLGQADFQGRRPNRGRGDVSPRDGFSDADADGFFEPTGVASNGSRLFVADRLNHRVLIWRTFPSAIGQPADEVLGQPSFTANLVNAGQGIYRPALSSFNLPTGVNLVGTTLWVADTENNRVVRWDNATTTPTAAAVLGQPDGSSFLNPLYWDLDSPVNGSPRDQPTSRASVLRPRAVAIAGPRIYVSESYSNRIHIFDLASLGHVGVLGQADDTHGLPDADGVTAATLAAPMGTASDGSRLLVADSENHRLLGWDLTAPPATGAPARWLVGQPSPLTNGFNQASHAAGGITQRPRQLARFGNSLFVADSGHHRVLVLRTPLEPGGSGRVFGQPDDRLALPNSGGAPSARTLNAPHGVFADAEHVVIADTGNHRVLVYDRVSGDPTATLVLGQASFSDNRPNRGGVPGAATLASPESVYGDGAGLWVADTANHRVLRWNRFPSASGQPADLVIGQNSFTEVLPNRGGSVNATGLVFPAAVDVVGGALFIADSGNNRVLRFAAVPNRSGAAADAVLGQLDLTSRGSAALPSDLRRLAGPVAMVDDGANLYVVDRDLGRVLEFELPAAGNAVAAAASLGSLAGDRGLSLNGPGGLAVEKTTFFTSRLYIADTGGDRLVTLTSISRMANP